MVDLGWGEDGTRSSPSAFQIGWENDDRQKDLCWFMNLRLSAYISILRPFLPEHLQLVFQLWQKKITLALQIKFFGDFLPRICQSSIKRYDGLSETLDLIVWHLGKRQKGLGQKPGWQLAVFFSGWRIRIDGIFTSWLAHSYSDWSAEKRPSKPWQNRTLDQTLKKPRSASLKQCP